MMDLRKLEIFARVAQLHSFSQAATSLHMAQPAVSIAIRKLEKELKTPLFDRGGRRIELTAEGTTLLPRAQFILQEVAELAGSADAMNNLLQGELSLACPSMLATYFLPDMLSKFLATHPGLQASITQAGTARVEQMLLADEVEVGVTTAGDSPNRAELDLVPLIREQMVVCLASDHPWAGRKRIAIDDLHEHPMVVYESGYFIRATLDQLCAERGVTPDIRMQSNFLPLLIKMVKQDLGLTVGLKIMADEEPGITGVPLAPATEINMALAKRKGRTISKANQAFLDWAAFKL
ncbi:MAG: LysR family transcriptional regulator [Halieaceae bacterium]|jgi:LysR family transcriptional regulator, cyn operon transcriptional activator|nr:LysR family transcriptional regulator [Halieaceae bacterium]